MSGIVLSASVRQNLLSLQSTAALLATTQEDLATGNRVNSALDNPTEYFTAQNLNNRASDISNLLDGINNGVQVLQQANNGITSLQQLIASAQSIANQVLQAPTGYSQKSSITTGAIAGADADNLLGTTTADATFTGVEAENNQQLVGQATGTALTNLSTVAGVSQAAAAGDSENTNAVVNTAATLGAVVENDNATQAAITGTELLSGTAGDGTDLGTAISAGATLVVDGKTLTFAATGTNSADFTDGGTINITSSNVNDVLAAIDQITGSTTASSVNGGAIQLFTGTDSDLTISGTSNALSALGLTGVAGTTQRAAPTTATAISATTSLAGTAGAGSTDLATSITNGSTLVVDGKTVTFETGASTSTDFTNGGVISLDSGTVQDVLTAIDAITGSSAAGTTLSSVDSSTGAIDLQTGTSDLTISGTGNALTALGLTTVASQTQPAAVGAVTTTGTLTTATLLDGNPTQAGQTALSIAAGDTLTVNGQTISFYDSSAATGNSAGTAANTTYVDLATSTVGDVLNDIDTITGGTATIANGAITVTTNGTTDISIGGTAAAKLGLNTIGTGGNLTVPTQQDITGATMLSGAASPTSDALSTGFAAGDTITVDGKTITFSTNPTSDSATGANVNITTGSVQDLLNAIDTITGTVGTADAATITNGQITLHTGTNSALSITSSNPAALSALGLGTSVSQADSALAGQTLSIASTEGGTATSLTFGTGPGQISTLNELNAALAANNLQASIDTTGAITITTGNNAAAATMGKVTGTATATGAAFNGLAAGEPVLDPDSQATRASLVEQYNNTMSQITTTAQDSSFNGINLLNGDTLNMTFDETGDSKLSVQGFVFNAGGLGLSTLNAGTDFLDSNSADAVLAKLNTASTTLDAAASALGSNLSVVQIRQDFNKNLVNVLQTGATNLTIADPNEEAANSQALSTRQSIAVSALALANQSQQSVLQLLR